MIYDYLVIGQGLAGSAICMELLKRKKNFLVFDRPDKNISSNVAAGIFNPITGRKWVKSWMADELFPFAQNFYANSQTLLGGNYFHEIPIFRPFDSLSHQNDWMANSTDNNYSHFIKNIYSESKYKHLIKNPFGGLLTKNSGYLDIPEYLFRLRNHLNKLNLIQNEGFDIDKVSDFNNHKVYNGTLRARKIIFCEGASVNNSEIWNFLPFRPVRGEIITIKLAKQLDIILNKSIFVLPVGSGKCRVGATYDRNIELGITDTGKTQLLNKLDQIIVSKFEVLDHVSGVRPATYDRRPFLGVHPNDENYVIFNGLGAKGVTLAPYFANQLLDHLENGKNLIKEVRLDRING